MKYQLKDFNRNIPDEDLLSDMNSVASRLGKKSISSREYNDGDAKYTSGTIASRFGTWNNALQKAGLELVQRRDVSIEELIKNLEQVWIRIGQQPTFRDMKGPLSQYSTHQYVTKFGTWRNALNKFAEYTNMNRLASSDNTEKVDTNKKTVLNQIKEFKHKTKRFPSERLKVQVLMRDGNKCKLCGVTVTGDNIHFDHIKPWSKGGETVLENIQVLCEVHNLAKGDLEYEP